MSYIKSVLQPEETVQFESRLHWIVYLPGLVMLIPAIAAGIGGTYIDETNVRYACWAVGAIFLLFAVLKLSAEWIRRVTTEIAVSDRRVIYRRGLIRRYTIEINNDKIESVDVDQTVLGRIFNFGTVVIRGTGSAVEPLRNIHDPLHFRSYITAR
jgi:uncharacterized membrane protein YdbT with pleckstrin-like domain